MGVGGLGGYMALPGMKQSPYISAGEIQDKSVLQSAGWEAQHAAAPLHWYLRMMSSCWKVSAPPFNTSHTSFPRHPAPPRFHLGKRIYGVLSWEMLFGQMLMVHGWQAERVMSTAEKAHPMLMNLLLSTHNAPVMTQVLCVGFPQI